MPGAGRMPADRPAGSRRSEALKQRYHSAVIAVFISTTLLLLSAGKGAAASDPVAIATAIYQKAAAGKGESGGQFLWLDPKVRPRTFSRSLVALWAKAEAATPEGDIGPVDFDPVTNSQDPGLKSFSVVSEKQTAAAATVAVTLTETIAARRVATDRTVRYDFVLEEGRWKIDDIRSTADGHPWSLRKLLSESIDLNRRH